MKDMNEDTIDLGTDVIPTGKTSQSINGMACIHILTNILIFRR